MTFGCNMAKCIEAQTRGSVRNLKLKVQILSYPLDPWVQILNFKKIQKASVQYDLPQKSLHPS